MTFFCLQYFYNIRVQTKYFTSILSYLILTVRASRYDAVTFAKYQIYWTSISLGGTQPIEQLHFGIPCDPIIWLQSKKWISCICLPENTIYNIHWIQCVGLYKLTYNVYSRIYPSISTWSAISMMSGYKQHQIRRFIYRALYLHL